MITDALRAARTAAFRLASPAEGLWRRAAGKRDLPPLWLRRHTGPVSAFESAARASAELLDRMRLLTPGDTVLDAGCGCGAMVPELARRLGPSGRYVGFDVHAPSIRWCRRAFAADARLRFELAEIASPYGGASGAARDFRFPLGDAGADLVLAKSLFTHLLEPEARRYLQEIRRVLRPGRGAVVTAFLFDAAADGRVRDALSRAFPFAGAGGARHRLRSRPEAAVAWPRETFTGLIAEAGLRLVWMWPGFFPGAARRTAQDILLLGH